MAFRKNSNITMALLGKSSVLATALPAVGANVTNQNLPEGALVLVNLGMQRISTLTAGQDFKIVQSNGTDRPLLVTPVLNEARITRTIGAHKSAKQQITIFGYNPATGTGTLPIANGTSFYIKVRKRDNDTMNQSQPKSQFAQYKTSSAATKKELAFGLAINGTKNFDLEPGNGYLKFEVTSNGTAAVVTDATHNQDAIVVKGSKSITLVDTGTATGGNTAGILASAPVGTILFIAGATYEVASLNANVITLTSAFEGNSGTITAGTTYATNFGKLTAVTEYGIRLSGIENAFDVNKFRNYYANRFTATFSDNSATVHSVQGAQEGLGTWQKVALDEYMTYGFEGQNSMLATPPTQRYQYVISKNDAASNSNRYSAWQLEWDEDLRGGLATIASAKGSVLLYFNLDTTTLGVVPALSAEATLITALGGTVSNFTQVS